jgi:hypothetical protein
LLLISTSYSNPLKFNQIGKEIALPTPLGLNILVGGEGVKNFDQWTEELSKEIYVRNDEDNMKILWKMNEIFDDDVEEEE